MKDHIDYEQRALPGFTIGDCRLENDFFNDAYPSVFVTDGERTITLWQVETRTGPGSRRCERNAGLGRTAFKVHAAEFKALRHVVASWPNVEFDGPDPSSLCAAASYFQIRMPGGRSIEFLASPRDAG
ncbi:MAG: hypothetical protein K2P80_02195 [Beijerinckiaceae bacterium]|nr:hypothetical protein [Beijerinckiaceae bacterium]